MTMPVPEMSIVITALNEGDHLKRTLEDLHATLPAVAEIVIVDDGSLDGSIDFLQKNLQAGIKLLHSDNLGVASARNLGALHAHGEILIFLDAHMRFPEDWLEPLLEHVRVPTVGAVSPAIAAMGRKDCCGFGMRWTTAALRADWLPAASTEPFVVPLLGGAAIMIRREVFEVVGGFEAELVRWGSVGLELSLRLWLLGYEVIVHPKVIIEHLFRSRHPYPVEWNAVLHNQLWVAAVHFSPQRLERVIDALKTQPGFGRALVRLLAGKAAIRRQALAERRRRSDDWFFEKFGDIY